MTGQLADLLSFRRIADIPFDAYMAALDSWQLTGHDGELRLGHSLLRGPIGARSALRYLPDRGPAGPRAAAPAGADAAGHRALVAHRHRPRTHPVPAGQAQRSLLRGRPPPAGLPDPHATGTRAGAAAPRSGSSARSRQRGRPGSQPPIVVVPRAHDLNYKAELTIAVVVSDIQDSAKRTDTHARSSAEERVQTVRRGMLCSGTLAFWMPVPLARSVRSRISLYLRPGGTG